MQNINPTNDYLPEFTQTIQPVANRTALVVTDMQYATASREAGLATRLRLAGREEQGRERFDRIEQVILPNLQVLLTFFRKHSMPIVFTVLGSARPDCSDLPEHVRAAVLANGNWTGAHEHEILAELKPLAGEVVLRKTTISAFNSTGIETTLRAFCAEYVLFTGVSTNMCVDGAARDAAERGFKCLMVEDCCGAAKPAYHEAALITFQRLFGRVVSTDVIIAELEASLRSKYVKQTGPT